MARARGKPIEAPWWWVRMASAALHARLETSTLSKIGEDLGKAIGRTAYHYSVVQKFLVEADRLPEHEWLRSTQEFADAVGALLPSVPRMYYLPRSPEEAEAMHDLAKSFDAAARALVEAAKARKGEQEQRAIAEKLQAEVDELERRRTIKKRVGSR